MSHVSTARIRYDIVRRIEEMMHKQINPIAERIKRPEVVTMILKDLYGDESVRELEALSTKLPNWFPTMRLLRVGMPNPLRPSTIDYWDWVLPTQQVVAQHWKNELDRQYAPPVHTLDATTCPRAWEMIKDDFELYTRRMQEKQRLVDAVNALMDKAKSLNQAIKVMPSLVDFVDDETKKKLFDKGTTKRPKEKTVEVTEAELAIPPEAITALTKARMLADA